MRHFIKFHQVFFQKVNGITLSWTIQETNSYANFSGLCVPNQFHNLLLISLIKMHSNGNVIVNLLLNLSSLDGCCFFFSSLFSWSKYISQKKNRIVINSNTDRTKDRIGFSAIFFFALFAYACEKKISKREENAEK